MHSLTIGYRVTTTEEHLTTQKHNWSPKPYIWGQHALTRLVFRLEYFSEYHLRSKFVKAGKSNWVEYENWVKCLDCLDCWFIRFLLQFHRNVTIWKKIVYKGSRSKLVKPCLTYFVTQDTVFFSRMSTIIYVGIYVSSRGPVNLRRVIYMRIRALSLRVPYRNTPYTLALKSGLIFV